VKGLGKWTSGLIYTLLIFLFMLSVSAIFFNTTVSRGRLDT
jgi:hypothetical protein